MSETIRRDDVTMPLVTKHIHARKLPPVTRGRNSRSGHPAELDAGRPFTRVAGGVTWGQGHGRLRKLDEAAKRPLPWGRGRKAARATPQYQCRDPCKVPTSRTSRTIK